jgi:hypothetical protein
MDDWPLERVLAAMPPGEAFNAGELLARIMSRSADGPRLCTVQHRLYEGWLEGFLERTGPDRRHYRLVPGVIASGRGIR